jgi:hypothetical protein
MFGNMKDNNDPKSVESFTSKMASAIERAYAEKEKKEARSGKVEELIEGIKEENFSSTPESYWRMKYCAINKGLCEGPKCFFWDKNIPCFNLGTLGNCTFLVASTSILALAGIVGDMIGGDKE